MRAVQAFIQDNDANFNFLTGVTEQLNPLSDGGLIVVDGVENLTGATGKGVWGAVADPRSASRRWIHYE